jgi:hypothetical protein
LDVSLVASVFGVDPERVRRNLAVALDPDRRPIAEEALVDGVAAALEATAVPSERAAVPARLRDVYLEAKWAPLPPDVLG